MAVFTALTQDEVRALLQCYRLGALRDVQGITSGIENSNFFLTTDTGQYVLTVFERLDAGQLPFYLGMMRHLARKGLPVPEPYEVADGGLFTEVRGKPAAIVARLPGKAVVAPAPHHCAQVGQFLAQMHLAASDYPVFQPNLRGLGWWKATASALEPHLPDHLFNELLEEVIFQDGVARQPAYEKLPSGPIHADLFRDNVLFEAGAIGGVIDFYFAGCGPWLFDLAVTVNDWCVDLDTGAFDTPRAAALLEGYHAVRPLQESEHQLWRAMLRAAALRFWVSRLHDLHLPRPAAMLQPHDPARFERMLQMRVGTSDLPWVRVPGTGP
jgi:homoserine kinase type II